MRPFLILIAMLSGSLAVAQTPTDGTVSEGGGFTARGGFWWSGGVPYTRELSYSTSYQMSCGRYCAVKTPYYLYSRAAVAPPAVVPPKKVAAVPGWRADLLRLAAAKQAIDGKLKLAEAEQKDYLDSIKSLGLEGYFRGGYSSSATSLGSYGVQGSTVYGIQTRTDVYGTSLSSLVNPYGDLNVNVMYQQLARNVGRSQDLFGTALQGHLAAVDAAGERQARVAEIIAKGQVAVNALRALQPPPSSTTTTTTVDSGTTVTKNPPPVPPGEALPRGRIPAMPRADEPSGVSADAARFLKEVGGPKCAECHTGDKAKAGFAISNLTLLNAEQRQLVNDRILSSDPKKIMPPPDSKAGALSDAEKLRFLTVK